MELKELEFGYPVKFVQDKEDPEKTQTRYCRVIGHGLRGTAKEGDKDFGIVLLTTPTGYIYRKGISELQDLDIISYEKLKSKEKNLFNPYNGYVRKDTTKEKTLKIIADQLSPIDIQTIYFDKLKPSYSRVSVDYFANSLVNIFKKLQPQEPEYKVQKLRAINEYPLTMDTIETVEPKRHFILLSKKEYPEVYKLNKFSKPFEQKFRDQTSFCQNKVEFNEDDILLYFSHPTEFYPYSNHFDYRLPNTIFLGRLSVVGNKRAFVPAEIFTRDNHREYNTHNSKHKIVQEFIQAIMRYKYFYRRPNLDKEDFEIIENDFVSKKLLRNQNIMG